MQARGNIDAVAINIVSVGDDLALIHADTEFKLSRRGNAVVADGHQLLRSNGGTYRADHAAEFGQNAVSGRIDDDTSALADERKQGRLVLLQSADGSLLIHADQAAVAGDVCGNDCG